ncbi:hypothetical protein NLJ89_g3623 [Agrocybe chaxingu]|uniref:Cell cycle checkpoint control protein RAD9A n=1 Tax=Agrocybe chaxingu TaxID=84603 RepID=A0A9W8K255_9AGAR|nr:hypothetical protein NLJ89_g3623 [Agrocybe chaxingu]
MQATLDALSLKAFTKALTCLSRYGEELSIYATPEFLSFSATNSSKSAYCRFKYEKQFFSRYRLGVGLTTRDEWDNEVEEIRNVTGQLLAKALLSILKHRTVEKSVERCDLSIVEGSEAPNGEAEDEDHDSLESKLILRFHCKHGVIKTHRLLLLTPTSLMAPGVPDAANESRLTIGPKALKDLIDHFPVSKGSKSDPQLVWTFEDAEVGLKSVESSIDSRGRGQLSTEITISADEFDVYEIYESPTTIAFHLREFNATIAFADSMSLCLDLRFTDPSAPLFIDIEGDSVETLFVISTSQVQGAPAGTQRTSSSQTANNKKRGRAPSAVGDTPRIKKPMKVVQPTDPPLYKRSDTHSRSSSHIPGTMSPPSTIPNRPFCHASQALNNRTLSVNHESGSSLQARDKLPLFLPSSQTSTAEEILRSTGLGVEHMDADELADLLEGEGEEVDFSQRHALRDYCSDSMQVDQPDSLELLEDTGFDATQSSGATDKSFQPLFED